MNDKRLVLKNCNFLNVINGKVEQNKVIVASKQNIIWIGDQDDFEKEDNDKTIDVAGKLVIPGMMDCHVHLGYKPTTQMEREFLRTKEEMYGYLALKHAQGHLLAGFTTIRDCGGKNYGSSLRKIFEEKLFPGPRLLVAQLPISQWGNQEAMGPLDLIEIGKKYEVISGRDGLTHAVRDRKRMGSDFIKTTTTGGVLHGMESKVERSLWTDDELNAMVVEAHRLGMHVAAHAHGDHGINKAVRNNVDTIEHCTMPEESTLDLMKQKNTFLIPTQRAGWGLKQPKIYTDMPTEVQLKIDQVWQGMIENHRIAFEKGVNIAVGTDSGTPFNPHGHTAKELTLMVENMKMSPIEVIQAATINSAKAIKIDNFTGSIEIGKRADLVVVMSGVIENIKILEELSNIDYVIKDGDVVSQNGILV